METQADMYISTLRSMIRAMGGNLRIEAVFSEGTVEISQFKEAGEGTAGAKKPGRVRTRREGMAAGRSATVRPDRG